VKSSIGSNFTQYDLKIIPIRVIAMSNNTAERNSIAMRRILHTMLRVGDISRSVNFYTHVMGMRVLRTLEHNEDNYSLTFLGFGDESDTCVLELTYNFGVSKYDPGTGYGHIAICVNDCSRVCADIKERGGTITREPCLLKGSTEIIAFVLDPDGYQIELIQRPVL
jgi:lactoylglutathione lyase